MNAIIMASQHIFGALVIILLLLILGVVILSFADKIFTVYYERGQQHQWHTDNERFNSNAYWFSEDEPTMNLLKNFARGSDVRAARDEWRADRKKQNPTGQPRTASVRSVAPGCSMSK